MEFVFIRALRTGFHIPGVLIPGLDNRPLADEFYPSAESLAGLWKALGLELGGEDLRMWPFVGVDGRSGE